MNNKLIISGYFLIKDSSEYKGIERNHFEPSIKNFMLNDKDNNKKNIWEFYPDGFEKEAVKIYELNQISDEDEHITLLKNKESAFEIQSILKKNSVYYEIINCYIYDINFNDTNIIEEKNFIGFDIAYLGGDFFSAINNGLFINPDVNLKNRYYKFLNDNGLFYNVDIIKDYLIDYKNISISEANSNFYLYVILKT